MILIFGQKLLQFQIDLAFPSSLSQCSNEVITGYHDKLPVVILARQSLVDRDMSLMDRLRNVPNFSWCPADVLGCCEPGF